jgi:WD40 repeat protein
LDLFLLLHLLLPMPQPELHREGYGIFVRCCGLSASSSTGEFVATMETLDQIFFEQIGKKTADFFPNPYGGAIYCGHVEQALKAVRALVSGLGTSGISAAIGVAWGRFQRTTNVHEWNAAALPLNEAARLAFSDGAVGRVLVSPHVRNNAGARAEFSDERVCEVKGKPYRYHAIESVGYQQLIAGPLAPGTPRSYEKNVVLWDIVKYSTKELDDQADLSGTLALSAATTLHIFAASQQAYSPAGDGGFAVFDTGLQAMAFAKELGNYAASKDIIIRTGIHQGEVAFTKRGAVGPAVLRADTISARAPHNRIAILADVWRNLDRIAKKDWRVTEIAPDILALEPALTEPAPPRVYITVPPLPPNYIERPGALASLRSVLLAPAGGNVIALIALEGMGGIGKTVLAQALFKDKLVREAFPDGSVWITVGREPTYEPLEKLREVAGVLGAIDVHAAPETLYKTTIAGKAALIVIDDIWSKAHLDPFLAESPRSRFLFTTRDASIARLSGAREHRADLLEGPQSRELLALRSGIEVAELPPAAVDILRECHDLPGALSTIGGLLRGAAPIEWDDVAGRLRNADLTSLEGQLPPGQQSFFRATDVGVKALPPEIQQRYGKLAVLLDDMPAPLPVLQTLWNVEEREARRIGRLLLDRSLAQRNEKPDGDTGIRLHDLQLDYVRARYPDRNALELIRSAVRLSAHVIEKDPQQFASQMVGRLLPYRDVAVIDDFVREISLGAPTPWLRPLRPALHPAGTALLRTLEGHSGPVTGVAVTPDGQRAVSASLDKTLKVWDLATGRVLRTLEDHSLMVSGVAVTPDGQRAVSTSADSTLKVWDLAAMGRVLCTLEGHSAYVSGVAVTPDGQRAVSASWDKTLKVWDLATGRVLRTLKGHSSSVVGVAMTPDGQRAVSASWDNTLKVWDLATGGVLRTLEGHSAYVSGVAVTPDGQRAVSASWDNTLKVWDLATGRVLRTLKGHSSSVVGVAMTPDGQRVVSASLDNTLTVWDLATGGVLRTLEGHSGPVSGVAVTPDGQRAVSASGDKTLKVWDLATGRVLRTPRHSGRVSGVVVTLDGQRAVSASGDNTLKVWDLTTGGVLRTLEGHSGPVSGVAVTPDGHRAVSASGDNTLKVWDLATGRVLLTRPHSVSIEGVGVTPDGHRAVSAFGDNTLKVWDLATGRVLRTVEGHPAYVSGGSGVAVTPDGQWAVSASGDKTLKVSDLARGRVLRTLEGHSDSVVGVAVTPDSQRAVSASDDNTLKVWDLTTGRVLRTLEGHSDSVVGVAVTPDGQRAVSASDDNTLKVWDLATGRIVATFHCDATALCCAWIDLQRIVAGDAQGRVYILSLEVSRALESAT